ncbi:hypothetical protein [Arenicella xantha]|uniref:Uncharacterized protein n=1 Tax=Arenicella xantha TaxID=644221 RepID=A0A395JHP3_9GAMM|nr:hypothetical protein [Arenicella xantha]RBP47035.1 hypothetical protein DFR28_1119 [Arenicella xantha]
MKEPDYNRCSQQELADVLGNIDREKYRDRYLRAKAVFDSRGGNSEPIDDENSKSPMASWGFLLVLFLLLNYVLGVLLPEGSFSSESNRTMSIRAIIFIVLVGFGLLVYPGRDNEKEN